MNINFHEEDLMSLTDASRALPKIGGKRPHPSTLWRWFRKGLKGVRLEHVRLGHRVCTSVQALSRFSNALAAADEVSSAPVNTQETGREKTLLTKTSSEGLRDV